MQYSELARLPNLKLEEIFRSAKAPDLGALVGAEWRGYNLSAFHGIARHPKVH